MAGGRGGEEPARSGSKRRLEYSPGHNSPPGGRERGNPTGPGNPARGPQKSGFVQDVSSDDEPQVLSALGRAELGLNMRLTEYAGVTFSDDGQTVFLGVRPWEPAVGSAEEESSRSESDTPSGGDPDEADGSNDVESVGPADVQVWHPTQRFRSATIA